MFGRRLLNNKHKLTSEFKQPINYKGKNIANEEIKFNEEYENDLNKRNEKENTNKIEKDNIYSYNSQDYNIKEKKKSVIINKPGNFFTFSSGINLKEENENEGIYDINSTSGNFLKDNFSSQKHYEGGQKKGKETDHIFAPLTQAEITKLNSENSKNSKYLNRNSNKFIPKKLNIEEFNNKNKEIINNYSKPKIKNNDEIELNLNLNIEEEDPYCNLDESSCEMKAISKKKMKLMDKLGIDLEDEESNKDIDQIINDKVERIKEVKQHQRKCLLVENLDGLYGKSQNPNDILKDIYTTINEGNEDSEYEEEIDKWEKAQFKSGIKLNQLNLNDEFYNKNNNNEINLNYKYNNLYEKLNKKEGIEFEELINDVGQLVERDKNLFYNYVNKKNDYNIELNKIIENEKKLEKELNFYIEQYSQLKKKLINLVQDKRDENDDIKLDTFYISE